jgi:hypothetical protein
LAQLSSASTASMNTTTTTTFQNRLWESESYLINMTDQSVIFMQNWLISTIMSVKLWANNYRGVWARVNKKEQEEEQHPRFLIHFEDVGTKGLLMLALSWTPSRATQLCTRELPSVHALLPRKKRSLRNIALP